MSLLRFHFAYIFHLEQIIKLPNTQRAMKLNSPLWKKKKESRIFTTLVRKKYVQNSIPNSARVSSLRTKYNKITRYKRATKVNSPLFKRISKFHPFPFPFFFSFFLPSFLSHYYKNPLCRFLITPLPRLKVLRRGSEKLVIFHPSHPLRVALCAMKGSTTRHILNVYIDT